MLRSSRTPVFTTICLRNCLFLHRIFRTKITEAIYRMAMMMKMKNLLFTLSLVIAAFYMHAQESDEVLFTVEDNPIYTSEFEYIYNKTNGKNADYSEKSLREYLKLYQDFKLKVQKAKDLKLDTIPALIQELAGYKRQLSNNYLMDKEVTNKLLRETYDRTKYDVAISHILFRLDKDSNEDDEAKASSAANDVYKMLKDGGNFEELAAKHSDHQNSKNIGGYIGYFTALELPDFYELESAAYLTPVGEISKVLRTRLGYQIIKVMDKRPARGTIKASHILIRSDQNSSEEQEATARKRIDSVYTALKGGADFIELAKAVSEDKSTGRNGGSIGTFGINKYEADFEAAAFSLKNDGDISGPVKSSLGWHIIQRVEKPEAQPYEIAKSGLLTRIKRDSRFQIAQDAMVNRIKEDVGYNENNSAINAFTADPGKYFLRPNWKAPEEGLDEELFTIADQSAGMAEFVGFLKRNRNKRVQMGRTLGASKVATALFKEFSNQYIIRYEESQLEEKYPDFKSLMREYEEGILLFEATKILVWDKANEDSVGLRNFYEGNKGEYMWGERAKTTTFTLNTENEKLIAKALKLSKKKSPEVIASKLNRASEVVSLTESVYEKGKVPGLENGPFDIGAVSKVVEKDGNKQFTKITEILPKSQKSLKEARGYIVADYQDYLLEKWVDQLKNEYTVTTNEQVFQNLIKK